MVPIKISDSRITRAYAVQSLQEVLKERTQEETTEGALKEQLCVPSTAARAWRYLSCASKALMFRPPQPDVHLRERAISPGSLPSLHS